MNPVLASMTEKTEIHLSQSKKVFQHGWDPGFSGTLPGVVTRQSDAFFLSTLVIYANVSATIDSKEGCHALRSVLSTVDSGPWRVRSPAAGRCRRGLRRRRARSEIRPSWDHEVPRRPVVGTSTVCAAVSESRQAADFPNCQHSPVPCSSARSRVEKRSESPLGASTATDDCRLAFRTRPDAPSDRQRFVLRGTEGSGEEARRALHRKQDS